MVCFDLFDIAAFSALGRVVGRVQALQAVDWGEMPYSGAVVETPGSNYLASVIGVPSHHGDSDGELESVNMLAPVSPREVVRRISPERFP